MCAAPIFSLHGNARTQSETKDIDMVGRRGCFIVYDIKQCFFIQPSLHTEKCMGHRENCFRIDLSDLSLLFHDSALGLI